MRFIEFIRRFFLCDKNQANCYIDAIVEGVKEAIEELGACMGLDEKM